MTRDFKDGDEPTAAERTRAASLGRLVDELIAGETAPPALEADERALLETAEMIRAAWHGADTEIASPAAEPVVTPVATVAAAAPVAATPVAVRARSRHVLPWSISAVFAAAAVLALLIRPSHPRALPPALRSRSADALIGPIEREDAADAARRTDLLYADRLAGYRQLSLTPKSGRP